ncbi:Pyruvate kinase [Syntrophomonas zehnderi OL-4]|uniref:Pyruvate kinase n=1 Tax=Syntrophomonas zehnderi OL-4 TaxID=690567 RepID=A0A0E4GC87_9FIRM|nr:pyruvate kinase [Syntrophomonas zehnderi]CFY12242.1 Pyruvate kinase [Syntrophomonas zehnderi OL-4]
MRKTKIICTIGPASEDGDKIRNMILNGMNVARLNFSHGTHAEHKKRIDLVRRVAAELDQPVALMLDTKGPEIRTGKLKSPTITLQAGQRFTLTTREILGNNQEVQVSYPNMAREVEKGSTILIADGLINLLVEETTSTDIICSVVNGGEIGERKGINVPGVRINMPFLNPKDIDDIHFAIEEELDFIAASFVRTAEDVLEIRRILEKQQADIDIIAKIESQGGVDNLEDIIKVADGVMVARGDLGVEIPAEEVPLAQKNIINICNDTGKVVIIATQMLDSMMVNPRPTRAEVSDVANAIFDGADAIMLSGESAAGKYPVEAVETMARIAKRAEEVLPYKDMLRKKRMQGTQSITDAISYATCTTASNLGISAIITATTTGTTARMVAKYRPEAAILAVTPNPRILKKLALVWGVNPILTRETQGTDEILDEALAVCLEKKYINCGDMVVLTGGSPSGFSGGTNLIKVHVVGKILLQGMGIGTKPVNGHVRVIQKDEDLERIKTGDILVCKAANAAFSPYLEKVQALIAEAGGLTSDAAIMGLTLGIPVIVGAQDATNILQDRMLITVDTSHGRIYSGLTKVL